MDVTLTIPDEKVADFIDKFIVINPKPHDFEGTDAQWIKEAVKRWLNKQYRDARIHIEVAEEVVK